jgi:hypothetical protein
MLYRANLRDGGIAATPRDRIVLDLQHAHEEEARLVKRIAELRGPFLTRSASAAHNATALESRLAKVRRSKAKLWKALDAIETDSEGANQ